MAVETKEKTNEPNDTQWIVGEDDDNSFIDFLEYMEETIQKGKEV